MRLQVHNSHLEFGTYVSPRKDLLASWGGYEQHDSRLCRGELRRGSGLTSLSLSFGPEPPSGIRMAIDGDPGTLPKQPWCYGVCRDDQPLIVFNMHCSSNLSQVSPYDSLKDVAKRILQNEVATVHVIYSSTQDGSCPQLLHLASLSEILKCICRHFRHAAGSMLLLQQPICALRIGTWILDIGNDGHPLALLRPNVSLSFALSLLLEVVSVRAAVFLFRLHAGRNEVVYYSTSLFRSAGITSDVAASAVMGALNVIGTAMASFLMDNQGRKSLLITSFTGMEAWQDVDPDNMLYEELVALSEVVGTQSRGLAPELISSLPLSKYVPESPSASNSEKCVICHLEYEGGDIILTLPCKHQYHSDCIKKLA